MLLSIPCAAAEEEPGQSEMVQSCVTKWQAIYGPVPFKEPGLFSAVRYLNPQPDDNFTKFSSEILAETLLKDRERWIDNIFKDDLRKQLADAKPIAYYLNHGQNEPGLLGFKIQLADGRHATIVENYNAFCITIEWHNAEQHEIKRGEVVAFLFRNTRLPYENMKDIEEKFALQESLPIGQTFTNTTQVNVALIKDWHDMVFGFVGKSGVSFIFLKAAGGRAALGFPTDYNWINNGLYKADGITLVEPPAHSIKK
jgi:hypothetical protein